MSGTVANVLLVGKLVTQDIGIKIAYVKYAVKESTLGAVINALYAEE